MIGEEIGTGLYRIVGHALKQIGELLRLPNAVDRKARPLVRRWRNRLFCQRLKLEPRPAVRNFAQGLNVGGDQLQAFYGRHRTGWVYAVHCLKPLHHPGAIYFDTFVERTMRWHPQGPMYIGHPWIGIIHETQTVPQWLSRLDGTGGARWTFRQRVWKKTLPHCRGLFAMSEYSAEFLRQQFPHLPVSVLRFPTEFPDRQWSWEAFRKNPRPKIVQVGWYMRMLHAIYELPTTKYEKVALPAVKGLDYFNEIFKCEREERKRRGLFYEPMYETAEMLGFLPDDEFDALLEKNIAFVCMYDASANNTVIECIARATPLLVNPLPAVVEYLGEDYPYYYTSFDEAADKAEDPGLALQTHEYLKRAPIREKMSPEYFRQSILESEVYKSIHG
ncbi:MAG: hypothetical protein QG552_1598 [Thermodesulfobacteriota bacterium]|nr:hypothetical protein [Thermodesulfobacteriota bacterium]